jgi:hypothetical protein
VCLRAALADKLGDPPPTPPAAHPRPRSSIHPPGLTLTRRSGGSLTFTRPAFPSPTPPDGSGGRFGFCPEASHPAVTSDARPGGDGPSNTYWYPSYVIDDTADLHFNAPLTHATSCRTIPEMPF